MAHWHSTSFGVYIIRNKANGKFYIGSTTKDFARRWNEHRTLLRSGKHYNQRLQMAFNKYGEDVFELDALEIVSDREMVIEREQYWLDQYFGTEQCYNLYPTAKSTYGRKTPEERKGLISSIMKRIRSTPEAKAKQADVANRTWHRRKASGEVFIYHGKYNTYAGLVAPDGTEYLNIRDLAAFCREHGLDDRKMYSVATGKKLSHRGWTAISADRSRIPTTMFEFLSPDGRIYSNIQNLTAFCQEHRLSVSGMSQVYAGNISHHQGWRRVDGAYRRSYAFVSPEGIIYRDILNLAAFCREHGLNKDSMSRVHNGDWQQYKGWRRAE